MQHNKMLTRRINAARLRRATAADDLTEREANTTPGMMAAKLRDERKMVPSSVLSAELMNEYIKTFGEPGDPKIRTHILKPGMDVTICGLDAAGDDLIHDKPPESLPRGKRHRVTCEHCRSIIAAVRDHISAPAG